MISVTLITASAMPSYVNRLNNSIEAIKAMESNTEFPTLMVERSRRLALAR